MYFDPLYFLYALPALAVGLWAQLRVKSAFARASKIAPSSRLSGAQVAARILQSYDLSGKVIIEQTQGYLGDHYDPQQRVLRLSPDVYNGRSLAAFGVAAHEVGHAIQHAKSYPLLMLRNAIVPAAAFGSNASYFIIFLGMIMSSAGLILVGVALFSCVVFFQVVNLPVEFDASRRAKEILLKQGFVSSAEASEVSAVLNAAALTYVAAVISSIMTLLYYISRFQSQD